MLTFALLVLLSSPGAAPASSPPPAARAARAGRVSPLELAERLASARHPGVSWRMGDVRQDDVTYDGVPDVVLLGTDEAGLVVAVVEGPVTERSRLLSLRLRAGVAAHDAVCGRPADVQANAERPDPRGLGPVLSEETRALIEAGADAGGRGLVLVHAGPTGYCEAFHVLYDGTALAWWRATPASHALAVPGSAR
jgi:hypothetical protein